jgi:cytoskeletal protein CcmA (bactofilin family)
MPFPTDPHPGVEVTLTVRGDVASRGAIKVTAGGAVHGSVLGKKIMIEGVVYGGLETPGSVELCESSLVKGDIWATALHSQKGAYFYGRCHVGASAAPDPLSETIEDSARPSRGKAEWFWQHK